MFHPRKHSMVTAGVVFTRLLYAQLLHAKFSAPPKVGFEVPSLGQSSKFKACDLGMKLVRAEIVCVCVCQVISV